MKRLMVGVASGAVLAVLAGCSAPTDTPAGGDDSQAANTPGETAVTVADAGRFLTDAENELREFSEFGARTAWVQNNFITPDTNTLAASANADVMAATTELAAAAARFNGLALPGGVDRKGRSVGRDRTQGLGWLPDRLRMLPVTPLRSPRMR